MHLCINLLKSQLTTNAPSQPVSSKPRPLTESEANEVRSHNLDPTGMMIDADLPVTRSLTQDELQSLENQGIDSSAYKNKPSTLATDEERAAMERLITSAQMAQQALEAQKSNEKKMNGLIFNGLVFGTIEGLFLGLIPLVTGLRKNQAGLAFGGFFVCLIVGAVGGFILCIPCAALFWWLLKKSPNKSAEFKD